MAGAETPAAVSPLSFAEAEAIGAACFDRWEKMAGEGSAPLTREDMGWADLVQFVWRSGMAAIAERSPAT
ncbi:hypothetical protein V6U71_21570 [Sphingopyxis sp. J-6]|uniref:hypothetical protein n=1 Tax=Sphingopyxis sp. J-6 TaxID=3122054 RepID=UPI0039840778